MAKLQHTFVQGKMNKDLDERLVPNGQYRDAQNIQISTSEGSDVGAVENILGNTKKNFEGTGDWDDSFGLTNAACIGTAKDTTLNKLYWFITSTEADAIIEYDQATNLVSPVIVDINGVLNFSESYLITGVNILEGFLIWTDDLNEPRKIDIATFKAGSSQGGNTFSVHTQVYGRDFVASDVTVIKKKPNTRPTYVAASSTRTGNGVGINKVTTPKNFTELYNGNKVPREVGSSVSFVTDLAPNWLPNDIITLTAFEFNNERNLSDQYQVRVKVTSITGALNKNVNSIIQSISADMPDIELTWTCELQEEEPMFKFSFPRFAYRWKYADGELSAFSPWTNAVFVPDEFKYGSYDAYNEGMVNNLRKLTLSGFETAPADVTNLQILYKDSSENNVYKVEEVAIGVTSYSITSEVVTNVVDSNQILRPYDNVPIKAKSQEIISNRIVYGNYVQNYDIPDEADITVTVLSTDITEVKKPEETIKSLRDYQIGIVYLDENGRETPVFTNSTSTVKIGIDKASKVNKLRADSGQDAPSWATHFKYYVKEPSNEYYNISLDRYYADPDGYMWLSMPSAERNKVREGDFLILKKQHNSDLPVLENTRYKILDISNEAPEPVKTKRKFKVSVGITRTNDSDKITSGLKTFNFGGPTPNAGNSEFVNSLKQNVYIRFVSGANKTAFYEVETGGYTGDSHNCYNVTLTKKLSTYTWLDALGDNTEFTVELWEKRTDILPEYIGRFFVKINRDVSFDENVIYNFTNDPDDYEQDGNSSVNNIQATLQDNPDVDGDEPPAALSKYGWAENAGAQPSVTIFGKPTLNSKQFGFAFAPYDPNNIDFGTNPTAFNNNIAPGSVVQFQDSVSGEWSSLYIIDSFVRDQYSRQPSPVGSTDDEIGYYWNFTLTQSFQDEDIDASAIRISVRKRVAPTAFDEDSEAFPTENPAIFEVEPLDTADIDLYYEATGAIDIANLGDNHTLDYFNAYSFGNGVESNRIRDDFNAKTMGKGVKVSSVLDAEYTQERRQAGLIFSGIFNSRNGVNELNQFIAGLNITKDLNPIYGGIQKLHARDTDLVVLCEDKCFRVLADKDALYNADGNTNVTSNRNVLGQTIPYVGEFGISKNPESFASYGFRAYFTDKSRGTVIRLSRDGITEIADKGMSDYFQDGLKSATGALIGSYDERAGSYNIKIGNEQTSFKERVDGWSTRLTYVPEFAISLNNEYYTFNNGELWEHSNTTRANFYGTQQTTAVTPVLNDAPTSIKNFKTLSYEGDAGWTASIVTDKQSGSVSTWKDKEGIYFNYIKGDATTLSNIDTKEFSVQGIGEANYTVDGAGFYDISFLNELNTSLQVGDTIYFTNDGGGTVRLLGDVLDITDKTVRAEWDGTAANEPADGDFILFAKDSNVNTSGLLGYYADVEFSVTSGLPKELFAVNSEIFISSE